MRSQGPGPSHSNFPLLTPNWARLPADLCGLVAGWQSSRKAIPQRQRGRRRGSWKINGADSTTEIPLGETRAKMARALQSLWGLACLPLCSSYFQLLLCVFALCRL